MWVLLVADLDIWEHYKALQGVSGFEKLCRRGSAVSTQPSVICPLPLGPCSWAGEGVQLSNVSERANHRMIKQDFAFWILQSKLIEEGLWQMCPGESNAAVEAEEHDFKFCLFFTVSVVSELHADWLDVGILCSNSPWTVVICTSGRAFQLWWKVKWFIIHRVVNVGAMG